MFAKFMLFLGLQLLIFAAVIIFAIFLSLCFPVIKLPTLLSRKNK